MVNDIRASRRAKSGAHAEVAGQEVIDLPERETMTLFSTAVFPNVGQTVPVDQSATGGVTNTVGDTTSTTTSLANTTAQSAPTQNGATAQNVMSPGATTYATQSQYAPVTTT